MGIQDRDYMRRRRDDYDRRGHNSSDGEEAMGGLIGRFLKKYPNFFTWLTIGLAALAVLGLVMAKMSSPRH